MAAASYTTDLTTLNILDNNATPFAIGEPTGSTAGTTIATETDHFVVGGACVAKIVNATGISGLGFLAGSAITLPTDGAIYMWTVYLAANAIGTKASGGMQLLVGNTLANYKRFYVYGSDTIEYGGWQCNAIDPAQTASATQGTPNGTWQYFGMAANAVTAVQRGYPQGWDAVRHGRGSIIMINGDLANGYATFDAAAEVNDTNVVGVTENRWGILSFAGGTYRLQGRLAFGSAGTAVDFRDSNRVIFVYSTDFVTTNFNTFEIINAASRVDWTSISISSLTTVSPGRVLVTDNADFNVEGCTFTDMGTFTFLSNTLINDSVFRRCGLITHGSCTFTNNIVTGATGTVAMTTSNPANIQDCQFISGGTGHAITITAPGTYSFNGNTFSGYGGTPGSNLVSNSGSTDAAIYNNSGGAITLNVSNGSTPSVRNGAGATTTVNSNVSVTLTGLKNPSEVRVFLAGTTTEVAGTGAENVTSGSHVFSIGSGVSVDISILSLGYQNTRILSYSTTSSASVPVSQVLDRQYNNP